MARGENTANHPGRQVGRARWQVVPTTRTGSEPADQRTSYALTANRVPKHQQSETTKRYGTWDEAHARKRELEG